MDTKQRTPQKPSGSRQKTSRSASVSNKAPVKRKTATRSAGTKAAVSAPQKTRQNTTPRRRKVTPKSVAPEVVYTQPIPFNRTRFVLRLVTVVAVVLALLFGMSIFFKVEVVTVAGMEKYTEWDVREASGIRDGENLLTLSEARISSNIISKLPYVDSVRVGIKLPDTVKIEVKELDVVYAVETQDGSWWFMRADGGLVEKTNSADAQAHTKVVGVQIADPEQGKSAVAYQPVSQETTPEGEIVPVTVNAAQQLDVAISILQYLEDRRVLGEIDRVDVSNLNDLRLWYADRFEVLLGDRTELSRKIGAVTVAIRDYMESYDSGVLDASMTVQPDPEKSYEVIFTPAVD